MNLKRIVRNGGIILLWLLDGAAYAGVIGLPDPTLTPGAINPSVTATNIHETICARGYSTKRIRPPKGFTNNLKSKQLKQYGFADQNPRHYEEDHLIPLDIGGAPRDPKNLWPEPRYGAWDADKKDVLENRAKGLVCSGKVPLRQMQQEIAQDWIKAYQKYVAP